MIGSSIMPEAILLPAASASSAKITAMHSTTSYHNQSPKKAAPEHQLLRCTPGVLPARSRRLVGREHCHALRRRAPCACQRHHRRQHARHRQAHLCRFACGAPARDVGLQTLLLAVHGLGLEVWPSQWHTWRRCTLLLAWSKSAHVWMVSEEHVLRTQASTSQPPSGAVAQEAFDAGALARPWRACGLRRGCPVRARRQPA